MAAPSRLTKVGLQGRTGVPANTLDSFLQTVEFPVVAVASAAPQSTGVFAPTESMQVVSAYLKVNVAEATGVTKTVEIGITGTGSGVLTGEDVSATGPVGTPVAAALDSSGGAEFIYTLAGADFVELDAVCVVTFVGIDI